MFLKKVVLSTSQNSSGITCVGLLSFGEVAGYRDSPPEVFLGKGVLKICRKITGEHPKCDFNKKYFQHNILPNFLFTTSERESDY